MPIRIKNYLYMIGDIGKPWVYLIPSETNELQCICLVVLTMLILESCPHVQKYSRGNYYSNNVLFFTLGQQKEL